MAVFIGIITTPGTVGLSHDWAYGPFPSMNGITGQDGFNLFSESQGNKIYPTDWPFRLTLILFAGLGGEILTKGMLVLFTALAGTLMFWLARELKLDYLWSVVAGIIYIFTPIVFTRSMAGHVYYLLAYALAPLAFLLFLRAIKNRPWWKYAMLSGVVVGIAAIQIQFLVMLPLVLLGYLAVDYKRARANVPVFALIMLVAFLIQLPWVLPLMTGGSSTSGLPTSSYLDYHEITNAPTIWESLGILGYNSQPYSYISLANAGIMPHFLLYLSYSFLGVALLSLVFRRDSLTISLSLVALLGVFLAKGTNAPGGEIFTFLFTHTPLIIFRELWHIVFLVVFPATILAAISLQNISIHIKKQSRRHRWMHLAVPLAVALLVIIPAGYPLMMGGNFHGFLQTYTLSDDYEDLFDKLSEEGGTTRILWVPGMDPTQYSDLGRDGVDPMIQNSPLPTFPSSASYQYPFSRANMFFIATMQSTDTTQFGNVLSPFGVTEIVARNDFTTQYPYFSEISDYPDILSKWGSSEFTAFLQSQNDLVAVTVTPEFTEYQTQQFSSMVSTPSTIVLGSPDLAALTHLANLTYLGNIAYLSDRESLPYAGMLFALDDTHDIVPLIAGQTIDPAYFVPAYDDLSDPHNGWIPAKGWFWYDPLFSTSMNTGIFTLGNSTTSIPVSGDDAEVWAKVMFWENGSTLDFNIGSSSTTIQTNSAQNMAQWVKVGDVDGSSQLSITSTSGRGYVDEILVVNKAEIASSLATIGDKPIVYLLTADGYDLSNTLSRSGPNTVDVDRGTTLSRWVDIYKDGTYSLDLDVQGHVAVSIGNEVLDMGSEGSSDQGTVFLREGRYQLNITALEDSTVGDLWMGSDSLSPAAAFSSSGSATIVDYQKNDPQSWQVKVNATAPFFLMLSEPYDPDYVAMVNGQEIEPVQAYSVMNGYWINQTGELTVDLVYKPQQQFETGLVIACLTVGMAMAVPAVDTWQQHRKRTKRSDDPMVHKY